MLPVIRHFFDSYTSLYTEEHFSLLAEQIENGEEDITSRKNFRGHVVADGCIIDPKHKKILLIYHKTLHKWLNPGGHIESGDTHPADAAYREVLEETGVRVDYVFDEEKTPLLLHIDSHIIPENPKKGEPQHWHHAMTFLFLADSTLPLPDVGDEGVTDCRWFHLSEMPSDKRFCAILDKIELF